MFRVFIRFNQEVQYTLLAPYIWEQTLISTGRHHQRNCGGQTTLHNDS